MNKLSYYISGQKNVLSMFFRAKAPKGYKKKLRFGRIPYGRGFYTYLK